MSNIIPPLLSNTPPPPPLPEEDEDDEFGDFTGTNDLSYGCDNLSLPPSPDHLPKKTSISNGLDINSNADKNKITQIDIGVEKDFQDRRKGDESFSDWTSPIEDVNKKDPIFEHSVENNVHIDISPTESKSEIYKALDIDKDLKIEFSEKENVNSFDETNQEVDNVQEVLSTNLQNEISNFVIDDDKKEIGDVPKELSVNISSVDSNEGYSINGKCDVKDDSLEVVKEHEIDVLSQSLSTVDIESNLQHESNGPSDLILSESEKDTFRKDDVEKEDNNISVINNASFSQNSESNVNRVEANNFESSQEYDAISKACVANEVEIISGIQQEQAETGSPQEQEEVSFTDDGAFGDFTGASESGNASLQVERKSEITTEVDDNQVCTITQKKQIEDNYISDDDFGDFSSPPVICNVTEIPIKESSDFDDDFGEFACTAIAPGQPEWDNMQSSSKQDDDEFGNFANFSEVSQEPVVLTLNEKQAFEKAEIILKEIFPCPDDAQEDFQYVEVEKNDYVFNELKDVTETPALLYQWSKSSSQNLLLKALNIDARNILYGPSWNPLMPRFAANLGLTPLEPVKTEVLTPTAPITSPSISIQSANVEIPSAQFDWNGSGLVNPLDYSQTMLLDLEQLVASLEIPTCNASSNSNNSLSPTTELDDWNIWLESVSKEHLEPSSPSDTAQKPLQLTIEPSLILQPKPVIAQSDSKKPPSKTDLEQKVDDDDFEDFTSYQPTQECQPKWPSVPLRETYISNDNITSCSKDIPLEIEGWLQPTIVTPELPRKDLSLGEEELPDIQTPELCRKNMAVENFEDEFYDFQMVLPETKKANTDNSSLPDILEPIKHENKTLSIDTPSLQNSDISFLSLSEDKSQITMPVLKTANKTSLELDEAEEKLKEANNDEDEFTDFHSFAPISQPGPPKTLTPILEPLKPVPVYPTVQYATTSTSTLINWPDPGITDEEIKKFEMVFSQPPKLKNDKEEPILMKEKKLSAESSHDDDEWSDFVSVQKPSPVHKFHSSEREHTSSPDLPLSVLNLGSIQPTKQPIPVITPQGLLQTKLSSHSSVNMSPKLQLKPVPQNKSVHQPHGQPSITSNQFASQIYNFNSYTSQTGSNSQQSTGNAVKQKSLDDDDWSDFVSSPLPPSAANGYQQNWHNVSSHQHADWTNASPNIITNPGHFVQSGSDVRNKKVPNFSVTSKKSTVPSISIPDLEFIAPKGRTSSSRKK